MALRTALCRVAAAFSGASSSSRWSSAQGAAPFKAPQGAFAGFLSSGLAGVTNGGAAVRSFHTTQPLNAKPALSGWAQWRRAANKRNRLLGAKRWNARVLTKQARKVQSDLIERWKIYRGDQVMVNAGKDRGQVGVVTKVFRKENRMIVEGLNLVKKHVKRTEGNNGGVITMESPVHYSNISLVDPVTGSPVRVGMRFLDDGTKVRVTRGRLASGAIVPKPDIAMQRRRPRNTKVGSRDTSWQDTLQNTYAPGPAAVGFF
jgi:large subunit ribosomal protein L24|tara:strand:+ start:2099 stop:2878 length:780 start_codon:yes stop_codon:yes gene_type:complete